MLYEVITHDLKERLAQIVVAYNYNNEPVKASDLKAQGAMAALLKDSESSMARPPTSPLLR